MLCVKPYRKKGDPREFGCGQCMPCRINKSRVWVGRMLLELQEHPASCFVTLTYDEEHQPKDRAVSKKDVQDFLKRLRWKLGKIKIRYFAVGEYGSSTWRPHYHLILFGLSIMEEKLISGSWQKGFVHVGSAEEKSISYVCSYVLKGMRKESDGRLDGRTPEFAIMSRCPGLGYGAVNRIKKAYETSQGKAALQSNGWFGKTVRISNRQFPIGRYLSEKIGEELGLDKEAKRVYQENEMYRVSLEKSSTENYQRKRASKVAAQMGKQLMKREVI